MSRTANRIFRIPSLLILLLILANGGTAAHSSYLKAITGASASSNDGINNQWQNDPQEKYTSTTVATTSSSVSTRSANASAFALADYSLLKVKATASAVTIDYRPGEDRVDWGEASASAGAAFVDTWTIDNKDLNGTEGTIKFHFGITGGLTGYSQPNLPSRLSALAELRFNDDWYTRWQVGEDYAWTVPTGGKSYSMSFIYGQPFTFQVSLSAGAGVNNRDVWTTSTADFSHTVNMDGIKLFSGNNEIKDFELIAASGHDYGFDNAVVTPEPASMLLMAVGGLGMAAFRRRRSI